MILILPGLFGLTLIGEGISKVLDEEWTGIISIIFGIVALIGVFLVYVIFRTIKIS
jgi:hypothetical protein